MIEGPANIVTLWAASTRQALGLASAEHLCAQELAQADRFGQPDDRDRFKAARALLRHALNETSDAEISPGSWRYAEGPNGKLVMAPGLPRLEFNLSHAGNCVAVGVSQTRPVGVDVEMATRDERLEIVTDVLSDRETEYLFQMPEDRRWDTFLQLWTLKEACAKALGLGVMQDFSELEVELDPVRIFAPDDLLKPGEIFDIETFVTVPDQTPARVSVASIRNAGEATEFSHRPFSKTFGRHPR